MRRSARVIVCICLCWLTGVLPALAATRLSPEIHHFIDVWGGFGYMGWMHSMKDVKPLSGVAPTVGVGYRVTYNRFVLQTGIEGQFVWTKGRMSKMNLQAQMNDMDIPNETFRMDVGISHFTDVNKAVNLQVPLWVGYEYGRFYGLVGATIGMNLYGSASSTATMQTTGSYDSYIGTIKDMPNHGFGTTELASGERSFRLSPYVMAHLELGARLDQFSMLKGFRLHKDTRRVYLGVFFEYCVTNAHNSVSQGAMVDMDYSHGVQAKLTPLVLCEEMKNGKLNPLTVGVKCAVLFELPKKGKSYHYNYNKVERGYIKRGGNQSIQ